MYFRINSETRSLSEEEIMYLNYLDVIQKQIERMKDQAGATIEKASRVIADRIRKDGVIHLFGCGHSHIISEEVFFRAGGLVPVNPILIEPLMFHEGAVRASQLERQHGYAQTFMGEVDIRQGDVVIVVSTSGRNPVPIEAALIARDKGAYVIGLTSLDYSKSQPSRHMSEQHLYDVVDLIINHDAVPGDAVMTHDKLSVPFGPTSTVLATAVINAIFVEVIHLLVEKGIEPPVFLSGNIDGADEHNQKLIEKYAGRLSLLK